MLRSYLDRTAVADRALESQKIAVSVLTQAECRACRAEPAVMPIEEKVDFSSQDLNENRPFTTERRPHRFEVGHWDLEL